MKTEGEWTEEGRNKGSETREREKAKGREGSSTVVGVGGEDRRKGKQCPCCSPSLPLPRNSPAPPGRNGNSAHVGMGPLDAS